MFIELTLVGAYPDAVDELISINPMTIRMMRKVSKTISSLHVPQQDVPGLESIRCTELTFGPDNIMYVYETRQEITELAQQAQRALRQL